ncbi:hypothetical protein [Deinococcus pimensis]|uniref:hypothetical protein n=1 Tax=Deinococcus pimensis TaxID=309888 RepID=UPI0004801CE1|nr:hypothetical protein [Deinococcus pimensis]
MLRTPVTPHPEEDDLRALSDDFTDAKATARWLRYEVEEGWPDQVVSQCVHEPLGQLAWTLRPSVWYAPLRGPLMYRWVDGDFTVSTRVRVQDQHGVFPARFGSLAGLMLRAPTSATPATWHRTLDNYVVHAAGVASGPPGTNPAIEITTTRDGHSGLEWYAGHADWVELRLARVGSTVALLHRFEGAAWTLTQLNAVARWGSWDYQGNGLLVRPDLPRRVQVGITAMADWGVILGHQGRGFDNEYFTSPATFNDALLDPVEGGLVALFDHVDFRRLHVPERWQRLDLNRDVTPQDLIELIVNGDHDSRCGVGRADGA